MTKQYRQYMDLAENDNTHALQLINCATEVILVLSGAIVRSTSRFGHLDMIPLV